MPAPAARMLVAVDGEAACIRIVGRANFASSVEFKNLVGELSRRGCNCFVLDLTECVLMDSTFLGLLASLGLRLSKSDENGGQGVELFNPNPRITDLLETLGVLRLFKITHGSSLGTASAEPLPSGAPPPTRAEITHTCLEAHKTLMALNPANAARFKDVAQFLAEGLKKSETK